VIYSDNRWVTKQGVAFLTAASYSFFCFISSVELVMWLINIFHGFR
jgi:hypothetical protein